MMEILYGTQVRLIAVSWPHFRKF